MFEAAIGQGGKTVMLCTSPPAREGVEVEFHKEAARTNPAATIKSLLLEGVLGAVRNGAAPAASMEGVDAILLAHSSTARAMNAVRDVTAIPVFSSPEVAVSKLRRMLA